MKKFTIALPPCGTNCLFLGLITLFAGQAYAQCPANPQPITFSYNGTNYTGTNVSCHSSPDNTWDGYFAAHPNSAFRVDGGVDNGAYNCHAFAWANTTNEWIDTDPTGTNIAPQIYYNSGYYIKTTDPNDAEIAVYGTGDPIYNIYPIHSAIHLTNTTKSTNGFARLYLSQNLQYAGWWISKWAGGPLAIHQLTSCPDYSPGLQITYFKKSGESGTNFIQQAQFKSSDYSIVGPKAVCSSGAQFQLSNATTGTINVLQPGFAVTWTGSSHITFSPNANTYPVTVSSSANGSGEWIKAHITFPDGSAGDVAQDVVWSGVPEYISSISTSQWSPGGTGYIAITVNQYNTELYGWPFNQGDLFTPNGIDSHGASSYDWSCSYLTFNQNPVVQDTRYTQGGFSNYQSLNVTSGGYMYTMSPNPASSQVTVSISDKNSLPGAANSQAISAAPASGAKSGAPITYTIRIIDVNGIVYYSSKKTGNNFTIPVNDLKSGNYVVEVSDGKTASSKPLLISH
jgi:hypothetical protein